MGKTKTKSTHWDNGTKNTRTLKNRKVVKKIHKQNAEKVKRDSREKIEGEKKKGEESERIKEENMTIDRHETATCRNR